MLRRFPPLNEQPPDQSGRTTPATIADVARDAGVSKTSVSRYLGGEVALLSDEMRGRIEASIARLQYEPSQLARSLKGGRSRLIGMVVADILNPYSVAVLHGAEAGCQKHGYTLMLCNVGNDEVRERQALAALRSYSVEGLILNSLGGRRLQLHKLLPAGVPAVLVDRRLVGGAMDYVGLDNVAAAVTATEHLIARGYRELALFSQSLRGASSRQERDVGFRTVLARHPDCHGRTVEIDRDRPESVAAQIEGFLAEPAEARKAILCASGVVGLAVVRALSQLKLRVPGDVGLLSFDELEWSELVPPGITTVCQPTYDIGHAALECLIARLEGDRSAPRTLLYPGRLIERGSTAPAGGDITPAAD